MKNANSLSEERRDFLKTAAVTGAFTIVARGKALSIPSAGKSRVVIVEDVKATNGSKINTSVLQIMMDEGIKSLTQINELGEAWKSLFPGIKENSKIAIKVNCINSALSSHPETAFAIANGLKKMMFGSNAYNENNIIIFERTEGELRNAKYTLNSTATGVRVVASNSSGVGYSTTTWSVDGSVQKISKVMTETVDYMVNLAVLKNHGSPGVTLCLKNHFGTCNNPGGLHNGDINKKIAELNTVEPIKTKQKVFIIDALYGVRSGGPGGSPQFAPNKLILGADIVAVDYWGKDLLVKNGCTSASLAKHIDYAADLYGLGTKDPAQMDVVNIVSPSDLQPSVLVTAPNGGEKWTEGTQQMITWTSNQVDNVKIEYSNDNGNTWKSINDSLPAAGKSYNWIVPARVSKSCKVKISDITGKAQSDDSNAVFEIVRATDIEIEKQNIDNIEVYPNPLSNRASIRFPLESPSSVRLYLTDISGHTVDLLYNGYYSAGVHLFEFNAGHLAAGTYFLQIKTSKGLLSKKIQITK